MLYVIGWGAGTWCTMQQKVYFAIADWKTFWKEKNNNNNYSNLVNINDA